MASLTVFILMVFLSNICNSQLVDCKEGTTCSCPPTAGKTCILDCDNVDVCKESTLYCRSGDECEIYCSAITACSSGTTINAGTATDVTITCSAEDSCKDSINIICGTGDCKLHCEHNKACLDWGSIDVSLSSSFECTGDCPGNVPSPFSSKINVPTITSSTTMIPTMNNNHNPTPTTPTASPVIYAVIPHGTVQTNDNDKDLSPESGAIQGFDIAVIGIITMTFCIVCVVIVWLFYMRCNKRKMRRVMRNKIAASHKRTISDSFRTLSNKKGVIVFEHHNNPSMDMVINASETPMRSPIICLPVTSGDGETLLNQEIEIELSKTFTVESIVQHQHTTRYKDEDEDMDDEDTDDDETEDDNDDVLESLNTTPPVLPCIPDHRAVTQSVNDLISQVKYLENDAKIEKAVGN